ncbi:MAG: anti-sigma factor antagonist [Bacteroidetes bacterium]|nr:MAG: anti-sigma factor antagonist [Bacteroidota bacterium]
MPVSSNITENNSLLTITIDGKFDRSLMDDFRASYYNMDFDNIVIDMRNTDLVDSSALGMLLNLRKYADNTVNEIKIINCTTHVKRVFEIARFEKRFTIS